MAATLAAIYRFPVKGLRGEPLEAVDVEAGGGLPHDRRFGIARGGDGTDVTAFSWRPKQRFAMLMRDAELARLGCRVDFDAGTIEIGSPGAPPCVAAFASPRDRAELDGYLNRFLAGSRAGPVRLVESGRLSFTDVPENCLSLINLASVEELATRMGASIHPLRFRGNLLIAGAPAWQEFDWVGNEIRVGDVRLRVHTRIPRCAATSVDPQSAERNLNVVKALKTHYGHVDMGVYAEVLDGGRLAVDDVVATPRTPHARSRLGHELRFLRFLARSVRIFLRRR
jgi:uncharacterized protein YcbX